MSRPESKNVFYFPHYTKPNSELELIEFRHGSEGYRVYFKLLELVADADYHQLKLKSQDDIDTFNLKMKAEEEIINESHELITPASNAAINNPSRPGIMFGKNSFAICP